MRKTFLQFITIISLTLLLCLTFSCKKQVDEEAEEAKPAVEAHHLNEFVGEWDQALLFVEQKGRTEVLFDKAKIKLTDSNTISSEFYRNDIDFILEYSPSQKNYSFAYSYRPSGTDKPLLSIDKIELIYSEEEGYTGGGPYLLEEKGININLEVTIKVGEGKVVCDISSAYKGGEKILEHTLKFSKKKSETK